MSKSLKNLTNKNEIQNEVTKWNVKECYSYLEKHYTKTLMSEDAKTRLMVVVEQWIKLCVKNQEISETDVNKVLSHKIFEVLKSKALASCDIISGIKDCSISTENINKFCTDFQNEPMLKNLIKRVVVYKNTIDALSKDTLTIEEGAKLVTRFAGDKILKNLITKIEDYCNNKESEKYAELKKETRRIKYKKLSIHSAEGKLTRL